jgi:hypothetical protein
MDRLALPFPKVAWRFALPSRHFQPRKTCKILRFLTLDKAVFGLVQSAALEPCDKADREATEVAEASQTQDPTDSFTKPELVERRIWRSIFVVLIIGLLATLLFTPLKFALGFLLGGVLALFNFKWLHSSVKDILSAGTSKAPPGTTMMFLGRWLIVAFVIYGASLTGFLEPVAMLTGLFAPALAVIIEAVYVTVKTLAQSGEDHK